MDQCILYRLSYLWCSVEAPAYHSKALHQANPHSLVFLYSPELWYPLGPLIYFQSSHLAFIPRPPYDGTHSENDSPLHASKSLFPDFLVRLAGLLSPCPPRSFLLSPWYGLRLAWTCDWIYIRHLLPYQWSNQFYCLVSELVQPTFLSIIQVF